MSDTATIDAPAPAAPATGFTLVTISDAALFEVRRLLEKETTPGTGLRLGVQGGGCSGLSYKVGFDVEQPKDHVIEKEGVKVFLDPKSAIYLKGLKLDFKDGLTGKGFVFVNPNATSSCGCGSSFSV